MTKINSFENSQNSRFSREPVYGEDIRTFEEEGRVLVDLQEALDNKRVNLIGSSIVGKEITPAVQAKLKSLDSLAMLGASVFCGESVEIITEDGGIIVIGDDCVIYNTIFRVSKGAVLMIEGATLLDCEITVTKGEHRIIGSSLTACKVNNSTLNDVEGKDSQVDSCLLRDACLKNAQVVACVGSAGGAEIGGIYQAKSISYSLDPSTGSLDVRIEDIQKNPEK